LHSEFIFAFARLFFKLLFAFPFLLLKVVYLAVQAVDNLDFVFVIFYDFFVFFACVGFDLGESGGGVCVVRGFNAEAFSGLFA